MSVRADTERAVDSRMAALRAELATHAGKPMPTDVAVAFVRAAYGKGYWDALAGPGDLRDEFPMVGQPSLLMP